MKEIPDPMLKAKLLFEFVNKQIRNWLEYLTENN